VTSFDPSRFPLAHLAVAVQELAASAPLYRSLGFELEDPQVIARENVRVQVAVKGELRIELLEPHPAGTGPVAKHLTRRGPGIHHMAVRVDDLDGQLALLKRTGIEALPGYPNRGLHGTRVAFLSPRATGGTLIELVETG
jgi:methylmalonyl-CoA/ethylmalonyl-CoA epimerase